MAAPGRRSHRRRGRFPRGPEAGEPAGAGGRGRRPLGRDRAAGEEEAGKPGRAVAVAGSRREWEVAAAGAAGPGDRGRSRAAEPWPPPRVSEK